MAYTEAMKLNLDMLLIGAMVICYTAGQFFAADAFSGIALALLLVFWIWFCGGVISWVATGR